MANVKISELTELLAPDGAEELAVNDSGTTKKITLKNLGTPKAWVSFDGTGGDGSNITPADSYNISSIDDNGTGDYTINFITNMNDSNYVAIANSNMNGTIGSHANITSKLASSVKVECHYYSSGGFDPSIVSIVVYGD